MFAIYRRPGSSVPTGRDPFSDLIPGTAYLATIVLSLRDVILSLNLVPGTTYLATIIKSLRDTNRFALPTLEDRFPFLEERPDSFLVILAVVDSAAHRLNAFKGFCAKGESMR